MKEKKEHFKKTKEEEIIMIHQSKLKPFSEQPYKVKFDESMDELAASIKEYGILSPIIVRKTKNGLFEIISGHRRVEAGKKARVHKFPAIVKNLNDDEAVILLVDSNLQRENILPSEKAFAYKLKLDAMKRQGKRTDLTSDQIGRKLGIESREILAEQVGESKNQISRYIRLTNLIDKLLDMVDSKIMPFNVGVELSYLGSRAQAFIADILEYDEIMLSIGQAHKIRTTADGRIEEDVIMSFIYDSKPQKINITIKDKSIRQYFPENFTKEQIESIVLELIKNWYEQQNK